MQALIRLTNQFNLSGFPPGTWAAAGMQGIKFLGLATAFTYWPLYLYQEREIPMTLVGLILLIEGSLSAFSQIIGGILSDRFGYRRIVILFRLGELCASATLAILISREAPIWGIVIIAIMVPTLSEIATPSILAIIANLSPKDRDTESFGLLAITGNMAWGIGPVLGGYLLNIVSFAWLFGIATLINAVSLICVLFLPNGARTSDSNRSSLSGLKLLIANRNLVLFSALSLIFALVMAQWGSTLSVFTVDRLGFPTEQYGLLAGISGLLIVVFQQPISRQISWIGKRKALVLGCILYGIGFLSLSWVKTFVPALGSIIVLVIGEMLFVPTAMAVVGQMSRPEDRGKSLGLYGLCQTLGFSLGPLLGGFLLDKYPSSPLYLWGTISLCSFLAAFGFAAWKGYTRNIVEKNSDAE